MFSYIAVSFYWLLGIAKNFRFEATKHLSDIEKNREYDWPYLCMYQHLTIFEFEGNAMTGNG